MALVALVFAVIEAPDKGWTSSIVVGSFLLGTAALLGFLAWESHTEDPMLDLALFRSRGFSIGSLTLMLSYFGALGTYFLYTQQLQFVLGYSALRAGLYSVPFAVALVAFSLQTPRLIQRFGTARVAGSGMTIMAVGIALRALSTASSGFLPLLVSLVVIGIGVGLVVAPSTGAIMGSLPPDQAGVGSAMNDAARQVGAATGVAVLGSIWSSVYRAGLTASTVGADVPAQALEESRQSVGAVVHTAANLPAGANAELLDAAKAAFVHGSNVANLIAAVVVSVAAVLAFRLLPKGNAGRGSDPDEAELVTDGEIAVIDAVPGVEGPEALAEVAEPVGR